VSYNAPFKFFILAFIPKGLYKTDVCNPLQRRITLANINDVAEKAGVSVATVSRVINGCANVSPGTVERVKKAIHELDYRPNLLGRALRRTKSERVLVLLPDISNPFYSEIVKGIEDVANQNGYSVMLCNTDSDINREKKYIKMLKSRLADGAILMASEMTCEELTRLASEIPMVQCCEYKEGVPVLHVSIDNEKAAYKATNHLINLGHRHIAFIGADNQFMSSDLRKKGFIQALSDAGIEYNPAYLSYGDYSYKSGYRNMRRMLTYQERPTAVFCISDLMAIGAIRAASDCGLRIPDDLAVCGFDNISFSRMFHPSITTIAQPMHDLGCTSMKALIGMIEGNQADIMHYILEHELIIRGSTVK
jgi:LacI family repressor for deo operon, udp, cdd, tsx, nupC, and nupG